jgi:hypothetical protein
MRVVTPIIEHREAALANIQLTTAMALLGCLTRKLLKSEAFSQDYNLGRLGLTYSRAASTTTMHTVLMTDP